MFSLYLRLFSHIVNPRIDFEHSIWWFFNEEIPVRKFKSHYVKFTL